KPVAAVLPALCILDWLIFSRRPPAAARTAVFAMVAVAIAGILQSYLTQRGVGALAQGRPPKDVARYVIEHTALQLRHYAIPVGLLPKYLEPLPVPFGTLAGMGALATVGAFATALVWAGWRRD